MEFDLFKPKAPPLFGLDISSSSVKMLEIVDAGKSAYRVERYAIEPLPRDAVVDGNINNLEAVTEAVRRAHKRLATRTKHVAMAVPTGAVISKKIVLGAGLREDELEMQVESEANQYIPFALDEVNLDFHSLGPAPNSPEEQEVLIAATRKEKVEDRVAVAESAGLKALVMDVESFAQQAALGLVVQSLPNGGKDQNVAVVDIGANVMNVTVLRNDALTLGEIEKLAPSHIVISPGPCTPERAGISLEVVRRFSVVISRLTVASVAPSSERAMGGSTAATGIDEAFGSPSVASIGPGSGLKTSSAVAPAAAAFCAFW